MPDLVNYTHPEPIVYRVELIQPPSGIIEWNNPTLSPTSERWAGLSAVEWYLIGGSCDEERQE